LIRRRAYIMYYKNMESYTLSDKYSIITFDIKDFFRNINNEYEYVHYVSKRTTLNPIIGDYYYIGNGRSIIISNDCIYTYEYCDYYDGSRMELKRCKPQSVILLQPIKDSNKIYYYIRLIQ